MLAPLILSHSLSLHLILSHFSLSQTTEAIRSLDPLAFPAHLPETGRVGPNLDKWFGLFMKISALRHTHDFTQSLCEERKTYMKSVAMHLVPIDLFYFAFKIIPTPFFQRVFVMLDDDGSFCVDFCEFIVNVWNYVRL